MRKKDQIILLRIITVENVIMMFALIVGVRKLVEMYSNYTLRDKKKEKVIIPKLLAYLNTELLKFQSISVKSIFRIK